MQFPGYTVTTDSDGAVTIRSFTFDETELTPESNWTECYGNSDDEDAFWGGRGLDSALDAARRRLSTPVSEIDIQQTRSTLASLEQYPVAEEIPFE